MNKIDKAGKEHKQDKKIEMQNNKKALNNKMKEELGSLEQIEDTTKYGEFVSSYFAWLTLEKQKEKGRKMEKMTDK